MPSPFSPFPPRTALVSSLSRGSPPHDESPARVRQPPVAGYRTPRSRARLSLYLCAALLILLCRHSTCPKNSCQAPFHNPWWLVETPTAPASRIVEMSSGLLSNPPARTGRSRTAE